MTEPQVLITFDSRGRATLPAKYFKHTKYLVQELSDGALLFTPVPGSERAVTHKAGGEK